MGSKFDPVIMLPALAAIVSMLIVSMSDKHVLPQTSSTFTLQAVHGYGVTDANDRGFLTKAEYELSLFKTEHMSPVAAVKYNKGCYGGDLLTPMTVSFTDTAPITSGASQYEHFNELNKLQREHGGNSPASICRCIDDYAGRAFTMASATMLDAVNDGFVAANSGTLTGMLLWEKTEFAYRKAHSLNPSRVRTTAEQTNYDEYFRTTQKAETFPGNYPHVVATAEYVHLNEIVEWCEQTAMPQYAVKFESVLYSRALLLVGLALVFAGLDIFGCRIKTCVATTDDTKGSYHVWAFLVEVLPVIWYGYLWWDQQWYGDIQDTLTDIASKTSFLTMLITLMVGSAVLLIFGVGVWTSLTYKDNERSSGAVILQRIITDVPMIVGLAVIGVALKLQNAEHDERILLGTLVVLTTAGLIQHLSFLVKIMYEGICKQLSDEVLLKLQAPKCTTEGTSKSEQEHLSRTREILQYFGWTRLVGFFIVLLFVVVSLTMSSSVAAINPLNAFTQNQYYFFAFAFVVAWTGLDFIYEILPFTSNEDGNYSEDSIEKMRKVSVLLYITFVMISQYTMESGEF